MPLTLAGVATEPALITSSLTIASDVAILLRPLEPADVQALMLFLAALSPETRRFSTYPSYDLATAQELCDAINRYDKLRLIIEEPASKRIVGLLEFSFDIPDGDHARFASYHVTLESSTDCRFGPCLADDYQNKGVGSEVFPYIADVAKKFEQKRIILWGGVFSDNQRAIRYYEKNGFKRVGKSLNSDQQEILDMILPL